VAFTLVVNLARGCPLLSLAAPAAIVGTLHLLWVKAARPAGIEQAGRHLDDAWRGCQLRR
jgi:hypothetical protein